jgi:hypothetical protein
MATPGASLARPRAAEQLVTWDEAVAIGSALPGVELSTSYGTPALKVRGKLLIRLRPEDDSLVLLDTPMDERDLLIEADPLTFHTTAHYDGYPTVLARLANLDAPTLRRMIERRWRNVAPARLVKAHRTSPDA